MLKIILVMAIILAVLYGGYAALTAIKRYAIRRSRRGQAISDLEEARKSQKAAKFMKGQIDINDPYQLRLDAVIEMAEIDEDDAKRRLREMDVRRLERRGR